MNQKPGCLRSKLVDLAILMIMLLTACQGKGGEVPLVNTSQDSGFSIIDLGTEAAGTEAAGTVSVEYIEEATSISFSVSPTASPINIPTATQVTSTPTSITTVLETSVPTFDAQTPITLENAHRLAQIGEIRFAPWELVNALAWAPDGEILAISAGEAVWLYRMPDSVRLRALPVGAFTQSLAFSPDGSLLAAGSRDGRLRVWNMVLALRDDIEPQAALVLDAHRKGVNSVAFNPDGSLLASGGNDAVARFWNPLDGNLDGSVVGGTFSVPGIAFTPQDATLAIVNGQVIRLRDTRSESILGTFWSEATLYSLAFHPNGTWLAAGGVDNLVRLWNPADAFRTGKESYPDPVLLVGHQGVGFRALIWQVLFSPQGDLLVSAGGDASVRVWDPAAPALLTTLWGHPFGATSVAFHPQGLVLASGGLDGIVRLWAIIP